MPADSGEWKRETGKGETEINLIRLERKGWDWDGRVLVVVLSDSIKGDRGPVVQCSAVPGPNSNLGISYDDEREVHADAVCHSNAIAMTGITIQ